jgi:hypothetical protein
MTASSDKGKGFAIKRPGRCVCVCTAKGKIVYIEDEYAFNKNSRR